MFGQLGHAIIEGFLRGAPHFLGDRRIIAGIFPGQDRRPIFRQEKRTILQIINLEGEGIRAVSEGNERPIKGVGIAIDGGANSQSGGEPAGGLEGVALTILPLNASAWKLAAGGCSQTIRTERSATVESVNALI